MKDQLDRNHSRAKNLSTTNFHLFYSVILFMESSVETVDVTHCGHYSSPTEYEKLLNETDPLVAIEIVATYKGGKLLCSTSVN
jgi:hypothetical protein